MKDSDRAALIATIGVVLAAVLAGAFGLIAAVVGNHSQGPKQPEANHSSVAAAPVGSSPVSGVPAHTGLRITYPPSGTIVDGKKGVLVKGTASGLTTGESGWLFDSNPENSQFDEDYDPNVGQAPVVTGNFHWSFFDVPVGSPGDKGATDTLVIVRASSACRQVLLKHTVFSRLPSGCRIDGETDIIVNYPKR